MDVLTTRTIRILLIFSNWTNIPAWRHCDHQKGKFIEGIKMSELQSNHRTTFFLLPEPEIHIVFTVWPADTLPCRAEIGVFRLFIWVLNKENAEIERFMLFFNSEPCSPMTVNFSPQKFITTYQCTVYNQRDWTHLNTSFFASNHWRLVVLLEKGVP